MVLVTAIVQGKLVRFAFADVASCKAAIARAFGEKRPLKKFGPDVNKRVAYLLPSQLGALIIDPAPSDAGEVLADEEPEEPETAAETAAAADPAGDPPVEPPTPTGN